MKQFAWLTLFAVAIATQVPGCGGGAGDNSGETSATYTVNYDGNGASEGTAPADARVYKPGETVAVLGNPGGLAKAGHSFTGWSLSADGQASSYTQAQTFSMGKANVTFYAKWTLHPTYTVTYAGNGNTGGSTPDDTTQYEPGQVVTVLGNSGELHKSGYDFGGWNTQPDGSGPTYAQAQTFWIGAENVTLYAKWISTAAFTVTYNGNGNTSGAVPSDSTHYQPGQTVTLLANTGSLERTNYAFSGWNLQADGSGPNYVPGQTFWMGSADVVLWARWTTCGDGIQQPGEQCDDGNDVETDACTNSCAVASCGDGIVHALGGEQCDGQSAGCNWNCTFSSCGDEVVNHLAGETCDEGSANGTGACDTDCSDPVCGDGVIHPATEYCDNGASNSNTGACTLSCRNPVCGDGFVQPGETCDDGNAVNGDGCSMICVLE